MKTFKQFLVENSAASKLSLHPKESMQNETESGLDWEYDREYKHYAKEFHGAFSSREHFGKEYKNPEVRHLTPEEHHGLSYATHTSYIPTNGESRLSEVEAGMGHRRDVGRIAKDISTGKTAYPIVLKHSKGMRILAGNTRMSVAASMGKSLPVKIIDISHTH